MDASAVLPATAYGQHLGLVLGSAQRAAPDLFANDERACLDGFARLSAAGRDLVARMVQRRRPVPTAGLAVSDDVLREAETSGWLEAATAQHGPQQEWWPGAAAPAPVVATTPARRLTRAALVIAFADPAVDLSIFPRIALGQIAPASGSPLAVTLAGDQPRTMSAFGDRPALDALLAAWEARNAGPDVLALARALDQVGSQAGTPLPLIGQQLTALHHWSHLLFDCLSLALPEDRRATVMRALRRAPLSANLARRVWSEVHRRQPRPDLARRLAADFARWRIWPAGERARWQLRADRRRQTRHRESWPTQHLTARLARVAGAVVADGESVEAHALSRLRADGWLGVHGEGGFWLGLTALLFHDAVVAPVDAAWSGPLQMLPLDWGRWGFTARRRTIVDRCARAIARDPLAALDVARAATDGRALAGLPVPPDADAARAVCAGLPRAALIEILLRVLNDPSEAGGLPDLVTWRAGDIRLWEVKSPNDQLSDRQRAWLAWLQEQGVQAGVLRVDARPTKQLAWVAPRTPAPAAPIAQRIPRSRPPTTDLAHTPTLLADGRVLDVHALLPTSDGPLAASSGGALWAQAWSGGIGERCVSRWLRPVLGVVSVHADAVLAERRASRGRSSRRWFALPPGWVLPALVAEEADPAGGTRRTATLLLRRSGWLIPHGWAEQEPVVVTAAELRAAAAGGAVDWLGHPCEPPPRPEVVADAGGWRDLLDAQLALVGTAAHCLRQGADVGTLELALPPDAAMVWVATDGRLRRVALG